MHTNPSISNRCIELDNMHTNVMLIRLYALPYHGSCHGGRERQKPARYSGSAVQPPNMKGGRVVRPVRNWVV